MTQMMKCGHAANATHRLADGTSEPSCVICAGIDPGALVVDEAPPSLEGRLARCSYYGHTPTGRDTSPSNCKTRKEKYGEAFKAQDPADRARWDNARRAAGDCRCEEPSSPSLAFFSRKDGKPFDEFYCGCWGWD